ncbi:RNA-directed DNA polymerase, eukaryota, partial [Tanacetum coccineum]
SCAIDLEVTRPGPLFRCDPIWGCYIIQAAEKLGCLILKCPFYYLGTRVGGSMTRVQAWQEIVEKVKSRLSKWKSKTLSIGGRLTLLKSVLGSIPVFHMSIFKVPSKVLHILESIRSHFFNGSHDPGSKKASWVKWNNVLTDKKRDGLGVSRLFALNRGLMIKWVWKFLSQKDSLWTKVIVAIHGVGGKIHSEWTSTGKSCWLSILSKVRSLQRKGMYVFDYLTHKMGNGESTKFWLDHWHTRGIFKDIFPRLYALESSKDVTVSSKIGDTSLVCSFRRIPRGGIEQNQFDSLVELVRSVTIVPSADRWNWNLESTGIFSVASARRRIDEICLPNIGEETRWVKCVPIKINVLAWKIKTDALPTRFNISRRGIDIQDMSCPICDNAIESTDHLFFRCGLVRDIANKVLSWWNLDHANLNSYAEWKSWLDSIRMDSKLKKMFEGVWYSIWWYVWIYRNKLLFDERKPSKSMLIDNVIASSFYWYQVMDLDSMVTREEIRRAVWSCGDDKSPGPDGFSFEFFRKYWNFIGPDFCGAVEHFFNKGTFTRGCNSSFIALIPKISDAKYVSDYRPISLIGCVYKVVTKILAIRLANIISDIISDTQSAFLTKRNILDGPFILNELLSWCKKYNKQAMFFKVDFAKAYDCVRWDYLLDVMKSFGFGPNWCRWIQGTLSSAKASILVNGSPTAEFSFYRGLKQGDPLSPFLFILIMESLHLSMVRASSNGMFRGLCLNGSLSVSHLFYADDAMFIGEWSQANLDNVVKMLQCFQVASGLSINIQKSNLLGVGVRRSVVDQAANKIGCLVMSNRFSYLGVMVGDSMNRRAAWVEVINKLRARLSNWKVKTLSIGGRYTLLKSVLGSSPLYHMSIFKTPKGVLKEMEGIRGKFFNGADPEERKIVWVAWQKVLASKSQGGLGVSSFFALNRALLLKWYWRFLTKDGSLWSQVIQAIHGDNFNCANNSPSLWSTIIREINSLKDIGFDFMSHCKIRIGNGCATKFWTDKWALDVTFRDRFPRVYALDMEKDSLNFVTGAELDRARLRILFGVAKLVSFFSLLYVARYEVSIGWKSCLPLYGEGGTCGVFV